MFNPVDPISAFIDLLLNFAQVDTGTFNLFSQHDDLDVVRDFLRTGGIVYLLTLGTEFYDVTIDPSSMLAHSDELTTLALCVFSTGVLVGRHLEIFRIHHCFETVSIAYIKNRWLEGLTKEKLPPYCRYLIPSILLRK